jgi:hypothetical protein
MVILRASLLKTSGEVGMVAKLLAKLIGGDAGQAVLGYFNKKQELKQQLKLAKIQGEIDEHKALAEYKVQQLKSDSEWSQAQIANSGWKDEYILVLLSIPLILVFVPFAQPYVLDGFEVLGKCPECYRWLVVTVIAAVYGVRPAINIWKNKNDNSKDV